MSKELVQASQSETGGIEGVPGDQTGREVCRCNWYAYPWNLVLRPKSAKMGESAAAYAGGIANSAYVGYGQVATGADRMTLYKELKKVDFDLEKLKTPCNCDCSSLIGTVYTAVGVTGLNTDWFPATFGMENAYLNTGAFEVMRGNILYNGSGCRPGDIFLNVQNHTAICVNDVAPTIGTPEVYPGSGAGHGKLPIYILCANSIKRGF